MAYSTGSPANERELTLNASPGSPVSSNKPFLVPTSNCVMSPSRDRGQHVHLVARTDRRLLAAALAVDEHVDVAADPVALVEDPAVERRLFALQLLEQLADGGAGQLVLGAAGE